MSQVQSRLCADWKPTRWLSEPLRVAHPGLQPGARIEIAPCGASADGGGSEKGAEPSIPTAFINGRPIKVVGMKRSLTAQIALDDWAGTGRSREAQAGRKASGRLRAPNTRT